MKAHILKIAGVKDEKSFYKKFPTEEAFMAKHGGAFKKAQQGMQVDKNNNGIPDYLESINGVQGPMNALPKPMFPTDDALPPPTPGFTPYKMSPENVVAEDEQITQDPNALTKIPGADTFSKALPIVGNIAGAISTLGTEKEARRAAKQAMKVSDITLQASASRPERIQRKYVRPEDIPIQPNQLFPTYGVGTNALTARFGKTVNNGGGEPEKLFDYGYVPLDNSSQVKQYQMGGSMFSSMMGGGDNSGGGMGGGVLGGGGFGSNPYGNMVGGMFGGNNGGSQIGGSIGSVFGPVGGAVGSALGGILDDNQTYIDRYNKKTNRNIQTMMLNNSAPAVQAGYASYLEDGGKMQSYGMGGELETHWGGHPETISQNKYLPNTGETVMFKGQSHDESDGKGNSGIGITYGNNPVEVEHGEPAVELPDENGNNLTVFGNLKISKEYAPLLNDKNASGKKFKSYVAGLSKIEAKQNRLSEKSISEINELPINTAFDKLKLSSLQANVIGTNMKLKDIADKKMNASYLQNAILEEAEQRGVKPEKVITANFGKTIKKYPEGGVVTTTTKTTVPGVYEVIGQQPGSIDNNTPEDAGGIFAGTNYESQWMPKVQQAFSNPQIADTLISQLENYTGQDAADVRAQLAKEPNKYRKIARAYELATDHKVGPYHDVINKLIDSNVPATTPVATTPVSTLPATLPATNEDATYGVVPYNRSKLADIYNQVLPFIRPTDQESFDPAQLSGEMYALSNNQVDPVQAQTYQPELGIPYDISLQDNLNANQADYRSVERLIPGNPASLAILNAQKYGANERVLGDQFRANQAMKDKVYSENRNTLNDAKLKNLSIYDNQYVRQSQALSNTKATTQAAFNSISEKYAKNKLENRTLGIYENLYNYRYDSAGRAINMNPFFQPNMPTTYTPPNGNLDYVPMYDENGKFEGYIKATKPSLSTNGINGNAKNSASIVRAFK